MMGTERRMSSGVASRWALYRGKASLRKVGPEGSKATPMWVGCSFWSTSFRVFRKPMMALVFSPFELIRGFLMKA